MFRTISSIQFGLLIFAVLLITKKSESDPIAHEHLLSQDSKIYYDPNDTFASNTSFSSSNDMNSSFRSDYSGNSSTATVKDSLKDKSFWHIFVMLTLSMSFCYYIKVVFKNFGSTHFNDDLYLTKVGSFAFVGSASARLGWGIL
jgi:hypothetical protein